MFPGRLPSEILAEDPYTLEGVCMVMAAYNERQEKDRRVADSRAKAKGGM